jgi:hypothetical protein
VSVTLPQKDYFGLSEVERRWRMKRPDTVYYAENGRVEISIRTHGLDIEEGTATNPKAPWGRSAQRRLRHDGLLALRAEDLSKVLRRGAALVVHFKAEPGHFRSVCPPSTPVSVRPPDLLVSCAEAARFEQQLEPSTEHPTHSETATSKGYRHAADFSVVTVDGRSYRFRGAQAGIVRRLHESAAEGRPWVAGKKLLHDAGSRSLRLADLFKRHPDWRDLIESDPCGLYRLKLNVPTAD